MNAIDTVVSPDENGRYLHAFTVRGKRFTMVPGGCSTFAEDFALFRVWRETGGMTDIKIRPDSVLSDLEYRHWFEL